MTLRPSRAVVLSLAVHAAIAATLSAVVAVEGGEPPLPRSVEATLEAPVAFDAPAPPPPEEGPPEVVAPAADPGSALLDGADAMEVEDARFSEGSGEAGAPAGTIGVGGGFPASGLSSVRRLRPAAAPSRQPAADVVALPAPEGPTNRARPREGACREPAYPARERRLGVEGAVEVLVRVDAEGAVESAEVARSSGSIGLDRAATEAVLRWRFEPALREGVPVPDVVRVRIQFELLAATAAKEEE